MTQRFVEGARAMIEFEMKATGIINTVGCLPGKASKYGAEVSSGVKGQIHQHAFCARLDMTVDGEQNSVLECNTYAAEDARNAFYMHETLLQTKRTASRRTNPHTQRYWKVINPKSGRPAGWLQARAHPCADPVRQACVAIRCPSKFHTKP